VDRVAPEDAAAVDVVGVAEQGPAVALDEVDGVAERRVGEPAADGRRRDVENRADEAAASRTRGASTASARPRRRRRPRYF